MLGNRVIDELSRGTYYAVQKLSPLRVIGIFVDSYERNSGVNEWGSYRIEIGDATAGAADGGSTTTVGTATEARFAQPRRQARKARRSKRTGGHSVSTWISHRIAVKLCRLRPVSSGRNSPCKSVYRPEYLNTHHLLVTLKIRFNEVPFSSTLEQI
jgi:hypothetical protein